MATQQHTDTVDPDGRLRCIVALARFTGRRESAICKLHANDVMFAADRTREMLAAAGMDERLADHMPHGAIRWRDEVDKQGFLFISPIGKDARAELERYLQRRPRIGDAPLFPAPGIKIGRRRRYLDIEPAPENPIRRETAANWLLKANSWPRCRSWLAAYSTRIAVSGPPNASTYPMSMSPRPAAGATRKPCDSAASTRTRRRCFASSKVTPGPESSQT